MNTAAAPKWIVDLDELTCYNIENQMLISFVKRGPAFQGKIREIPPDLQEMVNTSKNGKKFLMKAVIEADIAFYRAYFEREIERKNCEEGY